MSTARAILLESDRYSPNSEPHSLPALHWVGLFSEALRDKGASGVEERLQSKGWDPQWRYKMYSQAHYHSTTHELLIVIESSAEILLGGTDERARPKNSQVSLQSYTTVNLNVGDALLLPAGYAHRMNNGESGFTMIGSYPAASEKWDMRFPNVMGCQHDTVKIREMVTSSKRKGLLTARSPELVVQGDGETKTGETDQHWHFM